MPAGDPTRNRQGRLTILGFLEFKVQFIATAIAPPFEPVAILHQAATMDRVLNP